MHDVGKPVLLANLQSLVEDVGISLDEETTTAVLDQFHAQAGGVLASRWKLPPQVSSAILHHHDFAAATREKESAMIARLADLLAHFAVPGHVTVQEDDLRADPVLEALNLYPDQLQALLDRADAVTETVEALV